MRQIFRSLRLSPGYTAAFVLTLGLAIGANTAIFSVVRGVLLKPIPHRGGDSILHLRQTAVVTALADATWSVPEIADYRESATTIAGFAEFSALTFTMLGHEQPRRVHAGIVSANYFEVLGLRPVLGRLFEPADDPRTADAVMALSHEFWNRAYGADPGVVGSTARMNGRTITIVGVLEPVPHYPERTDVFVNTVTSPHHMSAAMSDDRQHRMTKVFARLAPGRTTDQALAELEALAGSLALEYPEAYETPEGSRITATPLSEELTHRARPTLFVLIATAAFVLFVACANVANLTMSRALGRRRELAVHGALGAGRFRLRSLVLSENLVLSLAGAALGLVLTQMSFSALVAYTARFTPRASEVALDGVVLATMLVLATGAAFLTALAAPLPAPGNGATEDAARAGNGRAARRLQRGFVVAQLALAFVLLAGAGLFTRSLSNLTRVDPGYDVDTILTMEIPARRAGQTPAQLTSYYRTIQSETAALPGVEAVALTSSLPLTGAPATLAVGVEGYALDPEAPVPRADFRAVSPDYFRTLGIRLVDGRAFADSDDAEAAKVVVINEAMASYYFAELSAVGRRLRWTDEQARFIGVDDGYRTVIGVAEDTRDHSLEQPSVHVVYQPMSQEPWVQSLAVRARTEPTSLTQSVTEIIRRADAEQPIENVRTLAEIRAETLSPQRLNAALIGGFAALSLVIAAVGVLGVLGFSVSQRTRELGVRASLGADARALLTLVLREALTLQAAGLVIGVIAAAGLSQFLRGMLFGVEPADPATLIEVGLVLATVATAAAFIPAWRASQTDPTEVLRRD